MLTKEELDEFYKQIGINIRNARNQSKISQEDLAKQLGFVSRISIANIESGKQKIMLHTLIETSEFLKIPIVELYPSVESIKKGITLKLTKQLLKEFSKEISDDPSTMENIKSFIRLSASSKK